MNTLNSGFRFHHLGLAVRRREPAVAFLRTLGYEIGQTVRDELQRVELALCMSPVMPTVEIVSRTDQPGPLDMILRRTDAQLYHMCYEVDDLKRALEELRRAGHRSHCVVPRLPAILFGGRHVSFHYLLGFGLVELLEPPSALEPEAQPEHEPLPND